MNDSQKLDEILQRLKAVEKMINPPLWKKIMIWIFNHLLFLLIWGVIAYFTWKTWLVIDHLQTSFEAFKNSVGNNTNAVQETIETGFEKLKGLKFWE